MTLDHLASIDDLRRQARRRLPRFVFDFVDGGADSETNLRRNREAFDAIELLPRYLTDISDTSTEVSLFGKQYAAPFGISAMGLLNILCPDADLICARLAAARRIPHMLSTAASTSIEDVAEAAAGYAWFQLYVTNQPSLREQLIARTEAAGIDVLVVTVDVPTPSKRDRDVRNQLQFPPRITPGFIAELVRHPSWTLGLARTGPPNLVNLADPDGNRPQPLSMRQGRMANRAYTWDDLKRLRDRWKGRMLLKGILHPEDASLALNAGCDGLIVSSHGGRQADAAPAAIDALPPIARTVAGRIPLLLDSGVRRGADIVRAKALGAEMVMCGRAFAFGLGAAGKAGCNRAFEVLSLEVDKVLEQFGRPNFADIDETILATPPAPQRAGNISVVSSKTA